MAMLPNFSFIPSITAVTSYFNSDFSVMQFSISAYLVFSSLLQIILGPLSDRFGRRTILNVCFTVFIIATIGCLVSEHTKTFIFFRILQATAVSGMVVGRAIAADIFHSTNLNSFLGQIAITMALVTIFAPLLGGFLLSLFDWQAIFYFLLFCAILALAYNIFILKETNKSKITDIREQLSSYRKLLKSEVFWLYSLMGGCSTLSFFSLMIAAPFIGDRLYNLGASYSSLLLAIITFGFIVGNILSTPLLKKTSTLSVLKFSSFLAIFGFAVSILFYILFSKNIFLTFSSFSLIGLSTGLIWPIASSKVLSIDNKLRGSAAGLNGAIFLGFGALASSATGILLAKYASLLPIYFITLISIALTTILIYFIIRREKFNSLKLSI